MESEQGEVPQAADDPYLGEGEVPQAADDPDSGSSWMAGTEWELGTNDLSWEDIAGQFDGSPVPEAAGTPEGQGLPEPEAAGSWPPGVRRTLRYSLPCRPFNPVGMRLMWSVALAQPLAIARTTIR